MTILDKTPNADVVEKHTALIRRSRVTKAGGCLLVALATVKEPTALRSQVQAELKELRTHVGKESEKTLLPSQLRERVQAVLKVEK